MSALDIFESFDKAAELVGENNNGCSLVSTARHIALSPKYIGRLRTGVRELLDTEVGRFSERLRGVLLAYGHVKLQQSSGTIIDDGPFIHFDVTLDAVVFKPKLGSLIKCVVNELASDHVGCLAHNWFNVSLLRDEKNVNRQCQARLEPGYVILVQVARLRSMNGMLAIEARTPDDGSNIILEATPLQNKDTDDESVPDSIPQPLDSPDGLTMQPSGMETSRKKSKKKKHSKDKQEATADWSESSLQAGGETTTRKKSKKHAEAGDSLLTGAEASHRKRKKEKNIKVEPASDPDSVPNLDYVSAQITSCEETTHKKKNKKKNRHISPDEASVQPPLTPTRIDVKVETVEEVGPMKRHSVVPVVSDNQPPHNNETSPQDFTKLKKSKRKDRQKHSSVDSSHPSLSLASGGEPSPLVTEGVPHKKAKKRKKSTSEVTTVESVAEIDSELTPKSHKKHKRIKTEFTDADVSFANGTSAKKKKKNNLKHF